MMASICPRLESVWASCFRQRRSLDVAFQDSEHVAQLALRLGVGARFADTMPQVPLDHVFRERFQATAGRDELRQNLRAIAVLFDHPLNGPQLAGDLSHSGGQRPLGLRRMLFSRSFHTRNQHAAPGRSKIKIFIFTLEGGRGYIPNRRRLGRELRAGRCTQP